MPLTSAGRTLLARITRIPDGTIPASVGGTTFHVRSNWDEALGGHAADIWEEDEAGDCYAVPGAMVPGILGEIERHDEGAYCEIEQASGKFERAA